MTDLYMKCCPNRTTDANELDVSRSELAMSQVVGSFKGARLRPASIDACLLMHSLVVGSEICQSEGYGVKIWQNLAGGYARDMSKTER